MPHCSVAYARAVAFISQQGGKKMKIELTKKETKLLIELLEEKLSTIPLSEASMRLDYGYIQCKLESLLKIEKSLS